jgi:ubiquitin-small subunit ribosomal protein S27Ae
MPTKKEKEKERLKEESKKEAPKKEEPKRVPEAVPEEKPEEKPERKEKAAPKPEKKKKEEKGVFTLYKIESDKVVRLRPVCERCGPGYFMADHGNRYTCGHCGFTRYKPSEK